MAINKKEKKYWEQNWGIPSHHLDAMNPEVDRYNFRDWETNDEDLFWITSRIKIIHQLDLDNTLVTDEGIGYLTRLELLKELRLKGCHSVTKNCLPHLNKIAGLELLHLIGTQIDLQDIAPLFDLKSLKTLLVSSEAVESEIKEKVKLFQQYLPTCTINVNYRVYE